MDQWCSKFSESFIWSIECSSLQLITQLILAGTNLSICGLDYAPDRRRQEVGIGCSRSSVHVGNAKMTASRDRKILQKFVGN